MNCQIANVVLCVLFRVRFYLKSVHNCLTGLFHCVNLKSRWFWNSRNNLACGGGGGEGERFDGFWGMPMLLLYSSSPHLYNIQNFRNKLSEWVVLTGHSFTYSSYECCSNLTSISRSYARYVSLNYVFWEVSTPLYFYQETQQSIRYLTK